MVCVTTMGEERRSRADRPRQRGNYRLTARDEELLFTMGRSRILSTPQIARLFFGNGKHAESTASRRMAKILALGLVRVKVSQLHEPNLYGLSEKGRDWLVSRDCNPDRLHVWRPPRGYPQVHHDLEIGNLRVALTLACKAKPGCELTVYESDADLRRFAGAKKTPEYVPDALVAVRSPDGERRFVIEIDQAGTQGRKVFGRTKAAAVRNLMDAHAPCWGLSWPWRPVVFAVSAARLRTLARAVMSAGGGDRWLGGTLVSLMSQDVLSEPLHVLSTLLEQNGATLHPVTLLAAPMPSGTALTGGSTSQLELPIKTAT